MEKTQLITGLGLGAAVGVALGALVIAPNLTTGVVDDDPLLAQHHKLVQENKVLRNQNEASDGIVSDVAPDVVSGTLSQRPVLVISTDDANSRDLSGITKLLEASGATAAGEIKLSHDFLRRESKDDVVAILKDKAPKKADIKGLDKTVGSYGGEVLGAALSMDPENTEPLASVKERSELLRTLRDQGFIDYKDGTILPAQSIIIVSGRGMRGYYSDTLAEFATALDRANGSVVLSARSKQTHDDKAIEQLRTKDIDLSTVDGIERAVARIAVIFAAEEQLNGGRGDYGAAESADSALPDKEIK
ncbi:copper transporter [Corynebacterium macginleyi]|uniref:Copper transporter n=1 Tax=Corynebacterium macginleyi TaxID=38290 RepID=A0ABS1Y697_9CORY|nr:copper transporter [Corynebacterium macginleyi]MBM0243917.1 copper transporter [Corynebacterium macginleyi]